MAINEFQRLLLQNAAFTPPCQIVSAIPENARTLRIPNVPHSIAEELGISCFGRITSYDARDGKTWPTPNMQNWDGGGLIPLATRSGRNSLRSLNQA